MRPLLFVAILAASVTHSALAQLASTTSLVGNVFDSGGAAVQGAAVTALNTGTQETYTGATNAEGYYEFQFIKIGDYTITVRQSGFESISKTGIPVATNQVVRNDFTLKVGQVTEQVEVTADVPPINTDNATVSEIISNKATVELPLNGRNPLRLAITVPTVIPGRKAVSGNPGQGEGYIGAGTREIQNSVSLDGVSIMNNLITTTTFRPSVDAVQEMQVQTGTYPAQYGGYMGVQVNLITRSGTNNLHGTVFEFLRNNAMDARGFFENPRNPQAPLRQNQFGFALTGPVVIPKLYDGRNRTFFLVNYEGLRQRQASAAVNTVLTTQMRQGDFSQVADPVRDPLTGTQFPGNIIPQNRLSPQALRALNYMPLPTSSGLANNYAVNVPSSNDTDQTINRVDQSIGEKVRLFFRYALGNTDLVNGSTNPFNGYTQPVRDRNWMIGYTQVFTPNLVNDFRFGKQNTTIDSVNFFANEEMANAGTEIGIPGFTTDLANSGLPNLTITGYLPIGGENMASSNWYQDDETWHFSDVLNIVRGSHSISTGFETRRLITQRAANNSPRGGFTFTRDVSGVAPADFMLGYPQTVTTPGPLFAGRVGHYRNGFFVSDKWQFSPKLTLTIGLRYELPTVASSLNGNATILNPEQTAFIPATVPDSIPFYEGNHSNWAPRFGFAYRLTDRWVLRGGYGIYYNANQMNTFTLATTNPPFSTIFTYNSSAANRLTLGNPTPQDAQGAAPKPNAFTINPNLPTAYMNQWSFSVERALWRNAGLDVQYVGSHSLHLDRGYFNNTPLPGPGNIDARRPNQLFRAIRTIQNDMIANYEALSFVLRQQVARGLTGLVSYTWSHTLDVASDSNSGQAPMNPYDWRADYGNSAWDLRHRFVASWTYELPFLKGSTQPLVKYLLANWQVNGILTRQSGFPYTVTIPTDTANTGAGNQRPNVLSTPTTNCGDQLTTCISRESFAVPAQFTYGNLGRNTLFGPGLFNLDFSMFKNVPITERVRFQIRGEFFNGTNTPGFANPNAGFGNANFGSITGTANNNRQIQVGAKLLF